MTRSPESRTPGAWFARFYGNNKQALVLNHMTAAIQEIRKSLAAR